MATYNYESLRGDNVKFLQGSQADLNKYLPNSTDTAKKGKAIEGAFYLTTDTHRLYVGRKVTAVPNPNPHSVAVNDVYPEEVSSGIATVVNTGELSSAQTGGTAHDGDFYYIKDSNVLAVYEEKADGTGSWQQINSPTGIDSFTSSFSSSAPTTPPAEFGPAANIVKLHSAVQTAGNTNEVGTDVYIKAGDNITIKPSTNNSTIEISSANSQSNLTVEQATAADNKAPAVLSDGINLDTKIYFKGAQDTTAEAGYNYIASVDTVVNAQKIYYTRGGTSPNYTYTAVTSPSGNPSASGYYERENIVTITGPGINGNKITNRGTAGGTDATTGFEFAIEVKEGGTAGTRDAKITNQSILDPIITIGKNATSDVKFHGGKAILDVYTTAQTDNKISSSITDALKNVDALHYKGTVETATALTAIATTGTVQAGDVYKASGDFIYDEQEVKSGDLLIAKGTETNGAIPAAGVTWEIVPSGDEPLLKGIVNATTTDNPSFGLEDEHIVGDYGGTGVVNADKRPLHVTFDNTKSTLIKANSTGTADNFKITLHHLTPTYSASNTTTVTTTTLTGATGSDSIGKNKIQFTAIKDIARDAYGHVTKITGSEVTLQHNYLEKISVTHSANDAHTTGSAYLTASDSLGITALEGLNRGHIQFTSETLSIGAKTDNSALSLDLKWGSF